ncbi:MAG TPA: LytTR family DNA-binding domain-containing protein [Mycobacteriales bacterium]|nr:LytTR family DNA-binding domain-containing protein [Mycobacteriales bacterium]
MSGLVVLAVDDETPALDELIFLLRESPLVRAVHSASNATDALREMERHRFDAVVLDVRMPGLGGLELARILARFAEPPAVLFLTAFEGHAVEAFDVRAVDYLLKPATAERLDRALATVTRQRKSSEPVSDLDVLPVETGGRTRMIDRSSVIWVEAAGDYVRLHTREGASYLVRLPISVLEERWVAHGFARVHRGYLVALREVKELRTVGAQASVVVAGRELPVSRRHLRELRERLVRPTRRRDPL